LSAISRVADEIKKEQPLNSTARRMATGAKAK